MQLPKLHRSTGIWNPTSAWRIADTSIGVVKFHDGWRLISLGGFDGYGGHDAEKWLAANGLADNLFSTRRSALASAAATMAVSTPPRWIKPRLRRVAPGRYRSLRGHFEAVRENGVVWFTAITGPARRVPMPAPVRMTYAEIAAWFAKMETSVALIINERNQAALAKRQARRLGDKA